MTYCDKSVLAPDCGREDCPICKVQRELNECQHKWSAPVPASYTYKNDNDPTIYTGYRIYISCEKCGEIKRK